MPMADPIATSALTQALAALALVVLGGGGTKGYGWLRRRNGRNGLSDADKIVNALQAEGRETRALTHECHGEMKELLGGIKTDTEVLRDRGPG